MDSHIAYLSNGDYKLFKGDSYVRLMPMVRDTGMVAANSAELMGILTGSSKFRFGEEEEIRVTKHISTIDGIAYHYDGNRDGLCDKIKIVHNSDLLKNVDAPDKTKHGALVISNGDYNRIEGDEFDVPKIIKFVNRELRRYEALDNPLWKSIAGDDIYLLDSFVDTAYKVIAMEYKTDTAMAFYLNLNNNYKRYPLLRAIVISGSNLGRRGKTFGKFSSNGDSNVSDITTLLGKRQ